MGFKQYAAAAVDGPTMSPSGSTAGPGGWHPTVLYMLGLVLVELIVVAWLSRHLLR